MKETIEAEYETCKEDPRVICLEMPLLLASAQAAYTHLFQSINGVNAWKPEEFQNMMTKTSKIEECFQLAFDKMIRYGRSVSTIKEEMKAEENRAKRNSGRRRSKIACTLKDAGCPAPLANRIASVVEPWRNEDRWKASAFFGEGISFENDGDWLKPRLFEKGLEGEVSHWQTELNRSFDNLLNMAIKKIEGGAAYIVKEDEITHLVGKLATKHEFAFNKPSTTSADATGGEQAEDFKLLSKMSSVIYIASDWAYSHKPNNNPLPAVASFNVVLQGHAWVTCVPLPKILETGFTLETLDSFLANEKEESLKKYVTMFVPHGSGFYVPFGTVAVCVGIAGTTAKKDGFMSSVSFPIMEENFEKHGLGSEDLTEITAYMAKRIQAKGKVFTKENATVADEWVKHLRAALTAPRTDDDGEK